MNNGINIILIITTVFSMFINVYSYGFLTLIVHLLCLYEYYFVDPFVIINQFYIFFILNCANYIFAFWKTIILSTIVENSKNIILVGLVP